MLDSPGVNPSWGGDIPVETGPGAHPASHTMGTGSFPGVKWPGRGIDHPPPSDVEVKARVELYIPSQCGPFWSVVGWTSPFFLPLMFVRFEVLQHSFWNFRSFGLWCCVFGWVFPDISKECSAVICRGWEVQEVASWTSWPLKTKAQCCSDMWGTSHPMTQCHIAEDTESWHWHLFLCCYTHNVKLFGGQDIYMPCSCNSKI